MKALILNFRRIKGKKDPSAEYVSFNMFDIEQKILYTEMFSSVDEILTPDGVLPTEEECKKTFPRMADIDFEIRQYANNGRPSYRPTVNEIKSWQYADLKKLG